MPVVGQPPRPWWSRRRRLLAHHHLLMVLAMPLLIGVAVMLFVRWRPVDHVYLIALAALTPFLFAPLVVADVVAWFSRSLVVRTVASVVTAAYLFTVAPLDAAIGCRPAAAGDAITIMTANVLAGGGDPQAVAANIAAVDPDVVVMQEVRPRFIDELDDQPGLDAFVERSHRLNGADRGVVMWSRWPMSDVELGTLDLNASVIATVDSPWGSFRMAGVHVLAPADPSNLPTWQRQFERLRAMPTDQAMVMAGDFNATEDHHPFRALLDRGWTDVHDDKGCGLDQTWPADVLPFPVMRLDHVLVTDRFEVLSTEIGHPGGSDHFPIISRIRLTSND